MTPAKKPNVGLLIIAYLGFISLGLPDTIIGVAWPSVRESFKLEQSDVALIFVGAGVSYFLSSFFTGRILKLMRIGVLLAVSSGLVALSAFGFGLAPVWLLFAACAVLHGLGSGGIDAGLNHYAAIHFSARQMNWLHACYSIGATFGPFLMTGIIAANASWRSGYLLVAVILLSLSGLFAITHRKWNNAETSHHSHAENHEHSRHGMTVALKHSTVWMQIVFFFIYAGLEVTAGQWSFTVLTESRSMGSEAAGLWVTAYWGSIAVGRVIFGFVVERLGIDRMLGIGILTALVGTIWFALNPPFSVFALPLIGLGLAPIYPCMMTQTPKRLGHELSAHAVGFQVSAAMLGVAALPSASGWMANEFGIEIIPLNTVLMAVGILVLYQLIRSRGLVKRCD